MKEVIGDATLYLGDCLEILPTLDKVDAVITSPPYYHQRDYTRSIPNWDYLMCESIGKINHSESCQVLVNLGQIHKDGEVFPYWEYWREYMRAQGWRFFGWYIWDKGFGLPGDWNGRLAPCHEYIFHFNKKSVSVNKWKPCKSAGRKVSGTGLRRKDNTTAGSASRAGDDINTNKIPDSVIRVHPEMRRENDHPAVFPESLPSEMLLSFTNPDQTILDPFMGSGTTGVACMNLGRKFIGIEIEPKYFEIACERIENAQKQGRLFE